MSDTAHEEMFAASPIKIGFRYRFDYPVEFTSLDEYSKRRGETVLVVEPAPEMEADVLWDQVDTSEEYQIVDRMWRVRAADGWCGCAWESELVDLV